MDTLAPSMRLKVKRDTFYIPDANRKGIYFRNNISSFRMEGDMITQWIDILLPMFNGEHTLRELTEGLPNPHRERVMEISGILHKNGFLKDMSQELPHQLTDEVLKTHSSQIEFLDYLGGSGAYRFQKYRQMRLLGIGSGPFFISLVSALIESGSPHFHILITDTTNTNRERLKEVVSHKRKKYSEIRVEEIPFGSSYGEDSWQKIIHEFDSVLYVSEGNVEELRDIHKACRQERKVFVPAIFHNQAGFAGPIVSPESSGCWESAWSRMHSATISEKAGTAPYSSSAGALLANVIVFELLKEAAEVNDPKNKNRFYLLNPETLEGTWHSFVPHPLMTGRKGAELVRDIHLRIEQTATKRDQEKCFLYFNQLTSEQSGIFHKWDEGDLLQLPLAQCRVQVVDPLAAGPAELLPESICTDLTHMEARIEAGLTGVEAYISRAARQLISHRNPGDERQKAARFIGVGAGETFAESVCRGLQKCLDDEFVKQRSAIEEPVRFVTLENIEDIRCQYYFQVLTIMEKQKPKIALDREVSGFPVVWVGTKDGWQGCVGLNLTLALRNALQRAVMKSQNHSIQASYLGLEARELIGEEYSRLKVSIPSFEESSGELLTSAIGILGQKQKTITVYKLELEPFLKEEVIKAVGVLLGEEGFK